MSNAETAFAIDLAALRFRRCQYRLRPPGWRYEWSYHRGLWEMYVCWAGRMAVQFKDRGVSLGRDEAVLIRPGDVHEAMVLGEDHALIMLLHFSVASGSLDHLIEQRLILSARALDRLRDLLDAMEDSPIDALRRQATLALLLTELNHPAQPAAYRHTQIDPRIGQHDRLVTTVVNHLMRDLAGGLNMSALTELTGYSASRLRHLFQERSGINLSEAMLRLRLGEAQRLLRHSSLKVSAIARIVGFRQPSRFGAFFRERTGMTPGQFARSGLTSGHKWGEPHDPDNVFVEAPAFTPCPP